MKYIFFGTPEFAAIILEKLIKAGFIPEAVVCNPDRPAGRKKIITAPPVKARIMNYESGIRDKIRILQPENLSIIHDLLFKIQPDLFIVAAYGQTINKEILEIPKLGTISAHPSLLPKHRGPSPIQTAILNGDEEVGATLYLMDEKIDHGPILAQQKLEDDELDAMNYEELLGKLAELSANLLIETLPKFMRAEIKPQPQDESKATYTKKFKTEDGYVKPEDLKAAQERGGKIAVEIDRKIRALNPEPGVWTRTLTNDKKIRSPKFKRVKLLETKIVDGKLKLLKIQIEGKKPQPYLDSI